MSEPGRGGFTLVELLAAVSIVAVVLGLALPGLARARRAADGAVCVANLRQIGTAIAAYAADNDGYLPGPGNSGFTYQYKKPSSNMTTYLAAYLGSPAPTAALQDCPLVLCPGYRRAIPKAAWNFAYYATFRVKSRDGMVVQSGSDILVPWGHPASSTGGATTTPCRLTMLASSVELSKTWAVRDADATSYGVYPALPPAPVHGAYWNQLYFDGHVGQLLPADRND